MVQCYNDILEYDLPKEWCFEKTDDTLSLYNPCGNGAMTVSLFNTLLQGYPLEEQICIMAKKFVDKFYILLDSPFIMANKKDLLVLNGEGKTNDNWYVKIWVIAKSPRIAFVTYQSTLKSAEIQICDSIVDSMVFLPNIGY